MQMPFGIKVEISRTPGAGVAHRPGAGWAPPPQALLMRRFAGFMASFDN